MIFFKVLEPNPHSHTCSRSSSVYKMTVRRHKQTNKPSGPEFSFPNRFSQPLYRLVLRSRLKSLYFTYLSSYLDKLNIFKNVYCTFNQVYSPLPRDRCCIRWARFPFGCSSLTEMIRFFFFFNPSPLVYAEKSIQIYRTSRVKGIIVQIKLNKPASRCDSAPLPTGKLGQLLERELCARAWIQIRSASASPLLKSPRLVGEFRSRASQEGRSAWTGGCFVVVCLFCFPPMSHTKTSSVRNGVFSHNFG